MSYTELLGVHMGDIVAIIGCNGKTSLLYALAEENRGRKVLLSTTTQIYCPASGQYDRVVSMAEELTEGINLVYGGCRDGKLGGVEPARLRALCPPDGVTLLESDGSRGLPFKGWANHEPVIPTCTTLTVGVCALWPVNRIFSGESVHRPELFAGLTGADPGRPVTMEHLAAMLSRPKGMFRNAQGKRVLFINRGGGEPEEALTLVRLLPPEFRKSLSAIVTGDLKRGGGEKIE